MLRTPFSFNATVSTAVANKISSSTKTQSDLYEEIADAVVAETGNVGLNKTLIVPEVIYHIVEQIEKDQGASLDEKALAEELFKQVKRIRSADRAILPELTDLYAAAAVGLQDGLALQNSQYDMTKAVLHLIHKLATDASSFHAKAEAAVYATVCYLDTISCPPDAVFTGAEKSIKDQLANLGTSTSREKSHQKTNAMRIFLHNFYPAFNAPSLSSTTSTATKPVMGGIVNYEAWTGGKPLADWSGLDLSVPQSEPHATQVRATSSKASTAMTKRTEGLFYEKEDKFKHGDDLAYFNDNLFEFFKLHGMDTITYRKDPTGTGLMHSVITDYPRFTVESVADQWKNEYEAKYDKYDKQNDYSAKRCFLSSLEESLHKNILAKINDTMTFPEVFLTFVQHEIPISHEKYESVERSIINFDVTQYPGLNVTAMTIELRRLIKTLVIARMWDSKNNSQLCRTLIDAGGDASNQEYLAEMYTMLAKVKKEIAKTGHLNNDDKIKHMTKNDVGWEDILKLADTLYSGMATPGQVRWPPALNPRDSKTPSAKFSVNLTQFKGHEQRKGKPYKKSNGNGHQNGNGKPRSKQDKPKDKSISKSKRDKGKSSTSKFCPPSITDQPFNHVNGTPIYCRTITTVVPLMTRSMNGAPHAIDGRLPTTRLHTQAREVDRMATATATATAIMVAMATMPVTSEPPQVSPLTPMHGLPLVHPHLWQSSTRLKQSRPTPLFKEKYTTTHDGVHPAGHHLDGVRQENGMRRTRGAPPKNGALPVKSTRLVRTAKPSSGPQVLITRLMLLLVSSKLFLRIPLLLQSLPFWL